MSPMVMPFHLDSTSLLLRKSQVCPQMNQSMFGPPWALLPPEQQLLMLQSNLHGGAPAQLPLPITFPSLYTFSPTSAMQDAARCQVLRLMLAQGRDTVRNLQYQDLVRQQHEAHKRTSSANILAAIRRDEELYERTRPPAVSAPVVARPEEAYEHPAKKAKSDASVARRESPNPGTGRVGKAKDDSSVVKENKKNDTKWLETLKKLKEYKDLHGDCIVPRGYNQDTRLASWVAEQRKQYKLLQDGKQSSITPERIALLEELNFAWNAQEASWVRHMADLTTFRNQYGHCHVPLNHSRFPKLGLWVKEQRRHYTLLKQGKPSHMTAERVQQLDKVSFCWDTHEETWLERFRELSRFKERHGHCIVPTNYSANPKLGTWVHHQRRQYKKFKEDKPCHITDERIRALESIGMVWFPRERANNEWQEDSSSDSEEDIACLDLRPRKRQRSL